MVEGVGFEPTIRFSGEPLKRETLENKHLTLVWTCADGKDMTQFRSHLTNPDPWHPFTAERILKSGKPPSMSRGMTE